jgi:hypothetical protein
MLSLGGSAKGDHRWMLNEEQHILRERSGNAVSRYMPLQLERFLVGNPSQRNGP